MGILSLMLLILSASISTVMIVGDSEGPASAKTSPQGSTANACPYESRFSECLPAYAAARTYAYDSTARALNS